MGSRLLKQWILYPLIEQKKIENRLDAVQLQDKLHQLYDLERLAGKLASLNANGRDLVSLKNSLHIIPQIKDRGC